MKAARRSWQPWVLRLAAFVLFISGGALAQRYLSSEAALKALPLERSEAPKPQAVLLETRQLEIVHPAALDAATNEPHSFLHPEPRVFSFSRLETPDPAHLQPRAFDAQAPPLH